MIHATTLRWFARHDLRLFWRDWVAMMTAGKRRREPLMALVVVVFVLLVHVLAYYMIAPFVKSGITLDKGTYLAVTGSLVLACTMMLSQAMEAITRAFYARADLDLILSSPAPPRRIFAVRMLAIALTTTALTMAIAGPFINAMVMHDGSRWFAAYGVLCAIGALATALAVVLAVTLFRSLGPKRTRLVSQIISAVVGAAFVIGVQTAAILSIGSFSRLELFRSEGVVSAAPDLSSAIWWPARAVSGDPAALGLVLIVGFGLLALVVMAFSANFGNHVLAAAGVSFDSRQHHRHPGFRAASSKGILRRKEWTLLRRDPWLLSESLMQVLYLIPPALLLWKNFSDRVDALLILVPVLVMASGQLAGGLAWLAVSGEDAPDLVSTAPVSPHRIITAKIESVLGAVAIVVLPLLFAFSLAAPRLAAVAALGIVLAVCSATTVQIWFRGQAKRSNFRRRQTSSRIATLAEALSSILWAGTAAMVAAESWFALGTGILALLGLLGAWLIRPRQTAGV